jgi:hypothetical protein
MKTTHLGIEPDGLFTFDKGSIISPRALITQNQQTLKDWKMSGCYEKQLIIEGFLSLESNTY